MSYIEKLLQFLLQTKNKGGGPGQEKDREVSDLSSFSGQKQDLHDGSVSQRGVVFGPRRQLVHVLCCMGRTAH